MVHEIDDEDEDDLDDEDMEEDDVDGEGIPGAGGDDEANDVPDGAAIFPLIPEELGVHPLLLATIHAFVFMDGSDAEVVHPDAGREAMEYLVTYLQRLQGRDLERIREDFETLLGYAREQKWPKQYQAFLKSFLLDNAIGQNQS